MNHSVSAYFDGSQWGSLLQHFEEGAESNQGTLKASEESFTLTIPKAGSREAITLNLDQVVKATSEILAACEGQPDAAPIKKAIVAGLEHLESRVRDLVEAQGLRGKGSFLEALDFYEANQELKEAVAETPETAARKKILNSGSSPALTRAVVGDVEDMVRENKNLLFKLTSYHESFFEIAGSRCPKNLLLPLMRDVLRDFKRIEPSSLSRFKMVLFHSDAPQPSFFELLTWEEDGNQLFDFLLQIVTEEELNADGMRKKQVLSFAYSVRRYDYIFMNSEELPSQGISDAARCCQTLKLTLGGRSIDEKYRSEKSAKYFAWLNLRQTSSTTLAQEGIRSAAPSRWNQADQKRSTFAKEHRGSSLPLTIDHIKELHRLMTTGEEGIDNPGEFRKGIVRTSGGWTHLYCPAEFLPANIDHFMEWVNQGLQQCERGQFNPVILGAQVYQRFVSLHPFENGNGRMARLMMDYVLERFDLPPPVLGKDILDGLFPLDGKKPGQEKFLKKIIAGIDASYKILNAKGEISSV